MSQPGSVSLWLEELKRGDDKAAQHLWERYYRRLVGLARHRLGGTPRSVADEEDVVVNAFDSFCRRSREGQYPRVVDRDDLWKLLVTITARKAVNQIKYQSRAKRNAGRVVEDMLPDERLNNGFAAIVGAEPTPEFAAEFIDLFQTFITSLDDPMLRTIALEKCEGQSNHEIAQRLGCCTATVQRKLRIIRTRLAYCFESE